MREPLVLNPGTVLCFGCIRWNASCVFNGQEPGDPNEFISIAKRFCSWSCMGRNDCGLQNRSTFRRMRKMIQVRWTPRLRAIRRRFFFQSLELKPKRFAHVREESGARLSH